MTNVDQPGAPGRGGTGIGLATPPSTETTSSSTDAGSAGDPKQQAKEAAGTAAAEGKHVTAVAGEEAQKVAAEAKQQTQALLEEARSQLEEQSRTQRDRLVGTLSSLGDDLERMSGQAQSGLAADLVQQASQRVRDLTSRLDGREPRELLGEVRDFARRKPGTFLLGALAAGVVAGRVARGAQKAQSSPATSSTTDPLGSTGLPQQRSSTAYDPTATAALPETPSAPAMADFPPDQPGRI